MNLEGIDDSAHRSLLPVSSRLHLNPLPWQFDPESAPGQQQQQRKDREHKRERRRIKTNQRRYNSTLLLLSSSSYHGELKYDVIRLVVDEQFNHDHSHNLDNYN